MRSAALGHASWRAQVGGGPEKYISGRLGCYLPLPPHIWGVPEYVFRSFHEGIHHVSNETQKPVAPDTKVEPAIAQPAPQQSQTGAKPNMDKPVVQKN